MGLFERFGRGRDASAGPARDPVTPGPGAPDADARAIERYRYLLRTAPPETIEQAHTEAFAQLTPEQRRQVFDELSRELPPAERNAVEREGASAGALARAATRAEMRRPGALERTFGSATPAAGIGGVLAATFLSSIAGTVLGSMIAQHFLAQHPQADAESANADHASADAHNVADAGPAADETGAFDDPGADLGDFDSGTFDV
jgi:hypothetical protein